ncbi:MAG: DUF488 family protein [Labilithrix sp.]|nr:DUF488 family protein [Labilithrix sp.]MBX3214090.1 DUF488 family protein [Labilithrix sp.]
MAAPPKLSIKRVYEPPSPADGARILVDRLWPRGLKKEDARLDAWLAQLAPSDELRRWFGHEPSRFAEFRRRYLRELARPERRDLFADLVRRAAGEHVTLVYAAKDTLHNNAVVLAGAIARAAAQPRRSAARPRAGRGGRSPSPAAPRPVGTGATARRPRLRA